MTVPRAVNSFISLLRSGGHAPNARVLVQRRGRRVIRRRRAAAATKTRAPASGIRGSAPTARVTAGKPLRMRPCSSRRYSRRSRCSRRRPYAASGRLTRIESWNRSGRSRSLGRARVSADLARTHRAVTVEPDLAAAVERAQCRRTGAVRDQVAQRAVEREVPEFVTLVQQAPRRDALALHQQLGHLAERPAQREGGNAQPQRAAQAVRQGALEFALAHGSRGDGIQRARAAPGCPARSRRCAPGRRCVSRTSTDARRRSPRPVPVSPAAPGAEKFRRHGRVPGRCADSPRAGPAPRRHWPRPRVPRTAATEKPASQGTTR